MSFEHLQSNWGGQLHIPPVVDNPVLGQVCLNESKANHEWRTLYHMVWGSLTDFQGLLIIAPDGLLLVTDLRYISSMPHSLHFSFHNLQ